MLQEPSSIEKVAEIDEHIGCAMSGLTADAKTLIDHARADTQVGSCCLSIQAAGAATMQAAAATSEPVLAHTGPCFDGSWMSPSKQQLLQHML